jgi:hypothetical protein
MKKVRTTHNGRKTATTVINDDFAIYFSKANTKNDPTFLTVSGINPSTGEFTKVRLGGRAVSTLRKVLEA